LAGKIMLKKLWQAAIYSMQGFASAIEHEFAFRLEIFIASIAIPLAIYFGHSNFEKALLVSSLLLVFIAELLNSAIEAVVDLISLEHSTLAGRAKDLGSATVFVACANVVVIWLGAFIG
jgi:diacylglycerol kinase (ATP)